MLLSEHLLLVKTSCVFFCKTRLIQGYASHLEKKNQGKDQIRIEEEKGDGGRVTRKRGRKKGF